MEKKWYESKGLWGGILLILLGIALAVVFVVEWIVGGKSVVEAAQTVVDVTKILGPTVGIFAAGLSFFGIRAAVGMTLLAFLLVGTGACATPGSMADPGAIPVGTSAKGPASGEASGRSTGTTVPFAPALSYMGSATASAISAGYTPYHTNTGSGSLITGFVQGLTSEQRSKIEATIKDAIENDVVLASIAKEMAELGDTAADARTEAWSARLDALRKSYREAQDGLIAQLRGTGLTEHLDLGKLEQIVVVGFIDSYVGKDERAPTKEESESLRYVLSNIVSAARGEKVILPPGTTMEKDEAAGEGEKEPEVAPEKKEEAPAEQPTG